MGEAPVALLEEYTVLGLPCPVDGAVTPCCFVLYPDGQGKGYELEFSCADGHRKSGWCNEAFARRLRSGRDVEEG